MAITGFPLDAVSGQPEYSGRMLRDALSALAGPAPAGRPLGATSGVRPGTPAATVSVAGSTCTVQPHSGVLDVQASAVAGPYCYAVTAAETKAVPAAHATYTRWDRVSVQLSDPAEGDGTSTPGVAVIYTAGTPAASPTLPAAPARSLTLARVVVPPSGGGAASVVWMAPETVSGGVRWYPTTQDRDVAIPAPSQGLIGVIGTGAGMRHEAWDGAEWRRIGAEDEQPFTPAWQQLAVGNGVSVGTRSRVGQVVVVQVMLEFGSTTSVSGTPYIDFAASGLPAAKVGAVGSGVAYDRSAGGFQPLTWMPSDWIVAPGGRVAGTVPWVWAPEDYMRLSMTYLTAEP